MHYAVIGGDMRFVHLARMLLESGRASSGFFQEEAGGERLELAALGDYDAVISNYPMRFPLSRRELCQANIFASLKPGSSLYLCGPEFPREALPFEYTNLWADEALLRENAYLTAEGAVSSAMWRLNRAIAGIECLVIGCGRIGRALTDILLRMGAKLTVASREAQKRTRVQEMGAQSVDTKNLEEVLGDMQLIFCTSPARVLDLERLHMVRAQALVIDLSGPPYGVDLTAARELGRHALRESGLPGRYCPLSAARALYNAILRCEGRKDT